MRPGGGDQPKLNVAFDLLHKGMPRIRSEVPVAKELVTAIRDGEKALNKDIRAKELDPAALLGRPVAGRLTLEQVANFTAHPVVPLPVGAIAPNAAQEAAAKKALRILKQYQNMMAGVVKDTETKLTNRVIALDPTKSKGHGLEHETQAEAIKETKDEMVAQLDRDKAKILGKVGHPGMLDNLYHNSEYLNALRDAGLITTLADQAALEAKHREEIDRAYEAEIKRLPPEFKKIEDRFPELERKARLDALAREIFAEEGIKFDPDDMPDAGGMNDEEYLKRIHEILNNKILFNFGEKGWFGTSWGQKTMAVVEGGLNIPVSMINDRTTEKMVKRFRLRKPDQMTVNLSLKNPDPEHKPTKGEKKRLKQLALAFAEKGIVPNVTGITLSRKDLAQIERALETARRVTKLRAKEDKANAALDAGIETKLNTAEAAVRRQQAVVADLRAELEEQLTAVPVTPPATLAATAGRLLAAQQELSNDIGDHLGLLKQHRTATRTAGTLSWTELDRLLNDEERHIATSRECLDTQQTSLAYLAAQATPRAAVAGAAPEWQTAVDVIRDELQPMRGQLDAEVVTAERNRVTDQGELALKDPPRAAPRRP